MAFSVRSSSVVSPRYLWATLKVTRENRARMTVDIETKRTDKHRSLTRKWNKTYWMIWAVLFGYFVVNLLNASKDTQTFN